MDDKLRRNREGAPVSEAPHASASEPGMPSDDGVQSAATHPEQPDPSAEPEAALQPDVEHENHAARVEHDLEELAARAQKADEYLELAQRTQADFENYRKRAAREAAAAQERGVAKLARELLSAVDGLERALAAAKQAGNDRDDLVSGLKLVHAEILAALARVGVEPFSPEGQPFDPEHHDAVAQQPVDGAKPGTCVEVYQRGYRMGDAVIRPAKVVVAG
jgi:molecular chaperone GrpE